MRSGDLLERGDPEGVPVHNRQEFIWETPATAEGATFKQQALPLLLAATSFVPLGYMTKDWSVFRSTSRERLLLIVSNEGGRIGIPKAPEAGEAWATVPDDISSFYVNLASLPSFEAAGPHGTNLRVEFSENKLVIGETESVFIATPAWLEIESRPAWLAGPARELLELRTSWGNTVAAGMVCRLQPPTPKPSPGPDDLFLAAREWSLLLSAEQRLKLDSEFTRRKAELHHQLQELEENVSPDDEDWQSRLARLFLGRDHLESVRFVLRLASGQMPSDIGDLDREGELFVRALPFRIDLADELLWNASLVDPEAWWTFGTR